MRDNGFIKIYRQMLEWEWYTDSKTKDVFIHLLLMANHKPKKWRGMVIERGQHLTSIGKIAEETGLSVKSVRTALNHLKETSELAIKTTNRYTLITVEKYEDYQAYDAEEGKQNGKPVGKQRANKGQAKGKQRATNKNEKNDKNEKNEKNIYTEGSPADSRRVDELMESYNNICISLPKAVKMTDTRRTHLKARLKEHTEADIRLAFIKAEESDFLSGRRSDWHADFDWIIKSENNLVKILEGHYDNRDVIKESVENDLANIYAGMDPEKIKKAQEVMQ